MSAANTPFEQSDPNTPRTEAARRPSSATGLPCDDVIALIPAYSIGATDPEEAAAVNTHLASCPTAPANLAQYSKIAEALLYAAPPKQAPAHLAAKLSADVGMPSVPRRVPRLGPETRPRLFSAAQAKRSPFTLVPSPAPKPVRRWAFRHLLTTAASLLLVLFNVALLVQNQQLRTRQEQIAAELDRQNRALIFLAAEEPQEVILPAAQDNSSAQADVLWNNDLGVAVVYVRAFPELPPDMAYQLWLRKGEQRTSAGLFTVDASGMGILVFPIEESLDGYDAMGITPEPAGGSPGPTAPAVVRRQFTN